MKLVMAKWTLCFHRYHQLFECLLTWLEHRTSNFETQVVCLSVCLLEIGVYMYMNEEFVTPLY